jgi:hypothetical protein
MIQVLVTCTYMHRVGACRLVLHVSAYRLVTRTRLPHMYAAPSHTNIHAHGSLSPASSRSVGGKLSVSRISGRVPWSVMRLGCGVWGVGCGVWGVGCGCEERGVSNLVASWGEGATCTRRVWGVGFGIWGLGFLLRGWGLRFAL